MIAIVHLLPYPSHHLAGLVTVSTHEVNYEGVYHADY